MNQENGDEIQSLQMKLEMEGSYVISRPTGKCLIFFGCYIFHILRETLMPNQSTKKHQKTMHTKKRIKFLQTSEKSLLNLKDILTIFSS